jgi:hypothetical protein
MLGRKINPVGLKGREIHNRIVDLMGINENVESVSAHDVKLTKKGPDGKVYAIVKENHKYFIKVAEGETISSNDLEYMGGLKNKIKESYPSYEKATKRLLHKFNEIARTQGLYYEGNILRNDNLLSENVAFAGGAGYGFAKESEENEIPENPEDYKKQPGYVGVTEETGDTHEIKDKIVAAIPKLFQDKTIQDISNRVMSDPKAIEALQQFMVNGVNESENDNGLENVKVPDMSFFKQAINYGVENAEKVGGLGEEEKDQSGNIGAFFGLFAGGAYLADKFFPNPTVMTKIATNIGVIDQLGSQYDPMVVAGLGGLAAAILGVIAYNVFKKKTTKVVEEMEDINGEEAPEDKETSGDNLEGDFEEKPKASSTNTGKPRSKGHETEVMKESKGKLSNVIENIDAIVDSILEETKKKSLK